MKKKKALKMTSELVIFRVFCVFFELFFFNISRKNSKTSKVHQQVAFKFLNISSFFLKIWAGQSLLTMSLSKIHRQSLKN